MQDSGRPSHLGLWERVFSPTKAIAFHVAEDMHVSGRASDSSYVAARLEQLKRVDERLPGLVRSELQAYGDPLP